MAAKQLIKISSIWYSEIYIKYIYKYTHIHTHVYINMTYVSACVLKLFR